MGFSSDFSFGSLKEMFWHDDVHVWKRLQRKLVDLFLELEFLYHLCTCIIICTWRNSPIALFRSKPSDDSRLWEAQTDTLNAAYHAAFKITEVTGFNLCQHFSAKLKTRISLMRQTPVCLISTTRHSHVMFDLLQCEGGGRCEGEGFT